MAPDASVIHHRRNDKELFFHFVIDPMLNQYFRKEQPLLHQLLDLILVNSVQYHYNLSFAVKKIN